MNIQIECTLHEETYGYEFNYYESIKAILEEGFTLENLEFNLSVVHGLPELVDAIWNLNIFDQLTSDEEQFEEIVEFVIDMLMTKYDKSDINWTDLVMIFDDLVAESDIHDVRSLQYFDEKYIQRATLIAIRLCEIVDSIGYTEFSEVYTLISEGADLINNDKILNNEAYHK